MGLLVNWHKWFQKKEENLSLQKNDMGALPESFMQKDGHSV